MTTFFYISIGVIIFIVILAIIAPKKYEISRNIIIEKPYEEVFTYLKLLKNHNNWSPWATKDPNMKKTYTGTDGEVGFISAWVGNKEVGEGEQEIIGITENEEIRSELRFFKPWKSTSDAYLRIENKEGFTRVIWGFMGKNKFPISIMMLFMNMEKAVGGDFESGLRKLKSLLENN